MLIKNKILLKDKVITVAYSGGADSTALFFALYKNKKKYGYRLTVCHLNHLIRNESLNEEEYIRNYLKKLKVPLYIERIDIPEKYHHSSDSIEVIARKERYNFLLRAASIFNSDYIFLAHHLDDLIETFFLNLFKGSGLKGLSSIKFKNQIFLRPLLNISKAEIYRFLQINKIKYFEDKTNYNSEYERNYIRNLIIPVIEKKFPEFKYKILDAINNIKETYSYSIYSLEKQLKDIFLNFNKCKNKNESAFQSIKIDNKFYINKFLNKKVWNLKFISKLDDYLLKELIHIKLISLSHNSFTKRIFIEKIFSIIKTFEQQKNKIVLKTNDFTIYLTYNRLYFMSNNFLLELNKLKKLYEKTTISFGKNYKFLYFIEKENLKNFNFDKNNLKDSFYFNPARINGDIYFDFRKIGDYIYKSEGDKRNLKKIFINEKVPFFLREYIPVLRDEKKILGIFIPHKNKYISDYRTYVNKSCKNIIKIKIIPFEEVLNETD